MSVARTVFMFSGQGSHYPRMGRPLFDTHDVFRDWMQRLDAWAHAQSGRRVLDAIHQTARSDAFDRTRLTHPAIFMTEYALAQALLHEGVTPDLVLGASLGSFAAAAIGGHLDVEDAMTSVIAQAEAFEASCERGAMLAILADRALYAEPFLRDRSELAGINFATHFAVSAGLADLDAIEADLKQRGITHQRLAVSHAFHSRWIDNAHDDFARAMQPIRQRNGAVPMVCCDRAATLMQLPDGFYWDVVRRPIRFADAIAHLERQGPHRYIDVGPSGTLATFVKYALPAGSTSTAHAVLTPYGQDQKNLAAVVAASRVA